MYLHRHGISLPLQTILVCSFLAMENPKAFGTLQKEKEKEIYKLIKAMAIAIGLIKVAIIRGWTHKFRKLISQSWYGSSLMK